jgi:catechol 2,3-dioxygenase-like lactoylglutathione lyase family enzyme
MATGIVHVRYIVDDVSVAMAWYTRHLGFTIIADMCPHFAEIARGNLHLLLSGPTSSAGRRMADGAQPEPGGWNRLHFIVDDIERELARLRHEGCNIRSEVVKGPGGSQALLIDPSGNLVEIFQPLRRP